MLVALVHMLPAQHGCPCPPHWTHVLEPLHTSFAPHALPCVQQGWVKPPHATQLPPVQFAPALHMLPAQHGSPATPHVTQLPPEHTSVAPVQDAPDVQQASPCRPQWTHMLDPLQISLTPHALPEVQHGWPTPPQATQLPPLQTSFAPHTPPAQQ